MSASIISDLDGLNTTSSEIITLLNSRRTGINVASMSGELPEIDLSSADIQEIFQKLHHMGSVVTRVITNSKKEFNTFQIDERTQNLIDTHAAALQTIVSIQQGQLSKFDYGLMLNAMVGFRNAILNLRNEIVTLSSYVPVSSTNKTKNSTARKTVGIVLTIIVVVVGSIFGGQPLYNFVTSIDVNTISNNPSGPSNNQIVSNSPGSNITLSITNTQNADEKSKGELPTSAVLETYLKTKPYSVAWIDCDYPPHEMLQNGATASQPMRFTPILLDKNGDSALIPFNVIFTFKIEALSELSSDTIEPDVFELQPTLIKPEDRTPITLEMIDYFEKAKERGAHIIKITLIESKIAPFSIEDNENLIYPEPISTEEILMTEIVYFKDQQQQDNWSKMINQKSMCDNLLKR